MIMDIGLQALETRAPGKAMHLPSGDWAELGLNPADFCQRWLDLTCADLTNPTSAMVLLETSDGSFAPHAVWPEGCAEIARLASTAQRCLIGRREVVEGISRCGRTIVAVPLIFESTLRGTVAIEVGEAAHHVVQDVLRAIQRAIGWLQSFVLRGLAKETEHQVTRAQCALDVLSVVGEQTRLEGLAAALCNDLAARFGCDRVALGVHRKGQARLIGLSHSAYFERKSQFVADLENAMDEALDQQRSICWPLQNDDRPPGVAIGHREFAASGQSVCSVAMTCRGRAIGVITVERAHGDAFSADEIAGFEAIAALLGPAVESRVALHHWFAGRSADALRDFWRHLKDPRRPALRVGVACAALLVVALVFVKGEYRVSAKSVIEGEVQRSVAAPFEGFIREAPIRAGMVVKKGELLASLDDRDLILERRRWMAERDQHERRYRDALAQHERASANVSLAREEGAQAQLALIQDKLARARVVAPFDGVVVMGDLTQLLGSPVEKGKLLFEVAPLDAYRVILKVDDRDIRHVHAGQAGRLVLVGLTGESLGFKVVNVSMPEAEDGKNLFRVEARLDRSDVKLRPGMEGVGKIVVGERSYGWMWTHRLFDWLRLQAWKWLP